MVAGSNVQLFFLLFLTFFRNNLDQKFREITNEYKQSTPLMNLPSLLTHYSSTTSWKPPESKEHDESLYNIVSVKDHTSKAYIIDYLLRKQSEMNEVMFDCYKSKLTGRIC